MRVPTSVKDLSRSLGQIKFGGNKRGATGWQLCLITSFLSLTVMDLMVCLSAPKPVIFLVFFVPMIAAVLAVYNLPQSKTLADHALGVTTESPDSLALDVLTDPDALAFVANVVIDVASDVLSHSN